MNLIIRFFFVALFFVPIGALADSFRPPDTRHAQVHFTKRFCSMIEGERTSAPLTIVFPQGVQRLSLRQRPSGFVKHSEIITPDSVIEEDRSGFRFYYGKNRRNSRGMQLTATASVIGTNLEITFLTRRVRRKLLYHVAIPLESVCDLVSVTVKASKAPTHLTLPCGHTVEQALGEGDDDDDDSSPPSLAATTTRQVDFWLIGDSDHASLYGSNATQVMVDNLNWAAAIYSSQLDLDFNVNGTTVFTGSSDSSIFTSTNSSTRLAQVASYGNTQSTPQRDLTFYSTGENLDGSVVGLAYFEVICAAPGFSYAMGETRSASVDQIITGHEIGHNLGGDHQASGLMKASLGSGMDSLSSASVTEIGAFVDANDSCLEVSVEEPGVRALLGKLKVKNKGSAKMTTTFKVTFEVDSGEDEDDWNGEIWCSRKKGHFDSVATLVDKAKKAATITSFSNGETQTFKVTTKRLNAEGKKFYCQAATVRKDATDRNLTGNRRTGKPKDGGKVSLKKLVNSLIPKKLGG